VKNLAKQSSQFAASANCRFEFVKRHVAERVYKEHKKVEQQQAVVSRLESKVAQREADAAEQGATIAHQQKQIETLSEGLQKVSAQVEASKPASSTIPKQQYLTTSRHALPHGSFVFRSLGLFENGRPPRRYLSFRRP